MHALLVSSNIPSGIAFYHRCHDGFGLVKSIAQFELVTLGLVSREVRRLVRRQCRKVPWLEACEPLGQHGFGGSDQDVVKPTRNRSGSGIPPRPPNLSRARDLSPLAVCVYVGFRFP